MNTISHNGTIGEWKSLSELYKEFLDNAKERRKWVPLFETATTYIDKLKAIRLYYSLNESKIIEHHRHYRAGWYNAYPIDWLSIFTPIELNAWNSIRAKGRIVLYPQYPVLGYFIDFANPFLKIGLELDGANYHDRKKDRKRDHELKQIGWTIYRVPGREMVRNDFKDFYDFEQWEWEDDFECVWSQIRDWIAKTGDGVIEAIKTIYFSKPPEDDFDHRFHALCQESLEDHCLV